MTLRIAANITLLFPDLPLIARVARAALLGFDGVECLFPYTLAPQRLSQALHTAGLPLALINTPVPDWDAGGRGCAAIPGAEARFQEDFAQALAYARICGAEAIHVMAGNTDHPDAIETFVSNLRWAAAQAPDQRLCLEPLNPFDMPGYALADFDLAAHVIQTVNSPNLGLQFDTWHANLMGGIDAVWQAHAQHVVHVQFAGLAQRRAPEAQDLPGIAALGFEGWHAAEYLGAANDTASWLPALRGTALGPSSRR